ncbi:MAG TPA: hypothetical protein PLO37_17945 [Candidatus Hydrogenedentes bacterium]|mgnify:CR=1 FL=1|nr:hypothetical protein [Candidatus Hydrogenedentota bacterium]HPG68733.1 hypothetical protein [Candidatus Hydrogenedentota bacterium]
MKHIEVVSKHRPALAQLQGVFEVIGVVQGLIGVVSMLIANKSQYISLVEQYRAFMNPVDVDIDLGGDE